MLEKLFQEFSPKEVSALAEYLYLGEHSAEGSGTPGSAWEMLWKEYRKTHVIWADAVDKVYQLHLESKINSDLCFQYLAEKK